MAEDKKIFIYAEGRDNIANFMVDDVKRATLEYGWTYCQLKYVHPSDLLDDERMDKIFPMNAGVILRNLAHNTHIETMNIANWLNTHGRVNVNFNAVGGLLPSNDKFFQQMVLRNDPRTMNDICLAYDVKGPNDVIALVKKGLLRYPLLLKPRDGSVGRGIEAVLKEEELESKTWRNMTAQNYIDSDYDWRVYVIGGVAIGAVRRGGKTGKEYDFHALANGIEKTKERSPAVLDEINRLACEMTAVAGLEYGGCDIIRDRNTGKYYILEVNTAATWEGNYHKVIRKDIAKEIIEWCDDRLAAKNQSKYDAIKTYIAKRLKYLTVPTQERYKAILNWKEWKGESVELDPFRRAAKKIKDKHKDKNCLEYRLARCYDKFFKMNEEKTVDNEVLIEARCLIDEIEGKPLCWAGNFIGSATWGEDGVLEDDCIPSAYYLAIKEKYDIMTQVKSKD